MENGLTFIEKEMKFLLPPFAKWSPKDWQSKGEESSNIVKQQLGWDITDFGSSDFDKVGLFLFTIRNGILTSKDPNEKMYAEKIIVKEDQITPIHFHYQKMEEHAIFGDKRCRIVKDRLGCHKFGFDDLIMELA